MKALFKNIEIYDEYYNSCTARHNETKNTTYKVYRYSMIQFIRWMNERYPVLILDSKKMLKDILDVLEAYIIFCRDVNGNNNRTINNKITAISSFYMWMVRRGKIPTHPFYHKLERLKCTDADKRRVNIFLTNKDIEKVDIMLEISGSKHSLIDRILWGVFLDSGARIAAIQSIKIEQIDLEEMLIRDVKEKGGKIVDILIFEQTTTLIKELLEICSRDRIYLFQSNKSREPISQSTIRSKIKKMGRLIGQDKLYPHTLRKSAINLLYNMSDIDTAAEFANHNDTKTTKSHYVNKRDINDLRAKIRSIHK